MTAEQARGGIEKPVSGFGRRLLFFHQSASPSWAPAPSGIRLSDPIVFPGRDRGAKPQFEQGYCV
jgi:hypothetical protein